MDLQINSPKQFHSDLLSFYFRYCNFYLYIAQFALVVQLDYGFISELTTRWSILISEEAPLFFNRMTKLLVGTEEKPVENIDWYLVGFVCGDLWKLAFDVKF